MLSVTTAQATVQALVERAGERNTEEEGERQRYQGEHDASDRLSTRATRTGRATR